MRTYLSIDLDYWSNHETDRSMRLFVEHALNLNVPTLLVREHHWLLKHINKHPAEHLINADHHDDIATRWDWQGFTEYCMDRPNEGTWASFVDWKRGSVFEWRYPNNGKAGSCRYGICDEERDVYNGQGRLTGWGWVIKRRGLVDIPWDDVIAVGIAISPSYLKLSWGDKSLGKYESVLTRLLGRDRVKGLDLGTLHRCRIRETVATGEQA